MKSIKKILFLSIIICVFIGVLMEFFRTVSAESKSEEFRKGEVIVEIKPSASIQEINERNRTTTIERLYGTNYYRLNIPPGSSEDKWIKRLERDSDVLSASLNPVVMSPTGVLARATVGFPDGNPSPGSDRTKYLSQPELFELLNLNDAQLRSRGAGVVVAVIDTGIDRTHPDLAAHLWIDNRERGEVPNDALDNDQDGLIDDARGWDFVDNDNDPTEVPGDPTKSVSGHGTFIAGLVALIAPDVRIMPIRAFGPDGMSNAFTVAASIKYAVDHGADVINLSFGSPRSSSVVKRAIKYARQNGAILVAAMGNEDLDTDDNPEYPAVLKNVVGVAAIDPASHKADFSNFGTKVGVDALGVKLISTFPGVSGGDYAMWSGTSFAAPLVASEAALILSRERRQNTISTIESTAVKIDDLNRDFSGKLGSGRIDPVTALDSLLTDRLPAGNYTTVYLAPASDEVRAQGAAAISVTGDHQEFEIVVRSLNVRTPCRLIVDGVEVTPDEFLSDSFGGLDIVLSTERTNDDDTGKSTLRLPAELYPVTKIKHVELLEGNRVVLQGNFAPIGGDYEYGHEVLEKRTPLAATALSAESHGKAHIRFYGQRVELGVEASGLEQDVSYKIVVDGIDLGQVVPRSTTKTPAYFCLRRVNDLSGRNEIPDSLQPVSNIKHVEIRDSSDRVILQGDFLLSLSGGSKSK